MILEIVACVLVILSFFAGVYSANRVNLARWKQIAPVIMDPQPSPEPTRPMQAISAADVYQRLLSIESRISNIENRQG